MHRAYPTAPPCLLAGYRRTLRSAPLPLLIATAAALLGGCAGTPQPAAEQPAADTTSAALERAVAATDAGERARHYLDAALAARQGDPARLPELLARLTTSDDGMPLMLALPPAGRFEVQALALEAALVGGNKTEVARLEAKLLPQNVAQHRHAASLRVRAWELAGDHLDAALALIQLAAEDADNDPGPHLAELTAASWRHLSQLSIPNLAQAAAAGSWLARGAPSRSPAEGSTDAAWLELARMHNAALSAVQQREIWRRWQAAHPRHVAALFPPPSLAKPSAAPRRIALLVPLVGDYAAAAEAVRDGFVAAYLHALPPGDAAMQEVRVYDTGASGVAPAYRLALAEGADAIVGPLQRNAVAALAALSPTVPVVALNYVEPLANEQRDDVPFATKEAERQRTTMLQLALAVEDEASAVAKALAQAGATRIALFDSPGTWWTRARDRFEAELEAVEVVATGTLYGVTDVTGVAGEVMGIDASNARHQALSKLLGTSPAFTPRRRTDVDAVVAFVDSAALMALKPALDFHFARELPVYVPSRAVRGVAWARLEGVRVCDLPWRLHRQPLRREAAAFATSRGAAADLFALGIDGFRVVNQLPRLAEHGETIAGSTGMLRAGTDGRIRRTPAWGEVAGGVLIATPDW